MGENEVAEQSNFAKYVEVFGALVLIRRYMRGSEVLIRAYLQRLNAKGDGKLPEPNTLTTF